MNSQRNQYVIGSLVAIVILVGAYLVFRSQSNSGTPTSQASSTAQNSSTTPTIGATGGYTIREITPTQPQQDVQAVLAQGSAAEAKGDYAGAERIWLSVTQMWPNDETAYNNLGDLYLHGLKNYQKAAQEYQKVVQLDPHNINAYTMLFAIYSEKLYVPSPTAAADILKQGISANPTNVQLQIMLARYYKSLGETAQANAEYDAAIANANSQGQTTLAQQIQQEKAGQ